MACSCALLISSNTVSCMFACFHNVRWHGPQRLRLMALALAGAIAAMAFWGLTGNVRASSEADEARAARHAYSESVAARYDDRFKPGNHFLPSNMTTDSGEFIDPKSFPTAVYCGHCHEAAHAQWRESAHANSNRAPWYLRNVALLNHEKGIEASRHCEGCHDPVAVAAGTLTANTPQVRRVYDDDGVTCSVCHAVQKVDTRGTGSFVLGVPAVLLDENGEAIQRPVSDGEILAHLDRHSAAVMKPFYKTSEFCAACHKAALPKTLNDYKWQRAISLYDEWQGSSFAKQSPLPFYQKTGVSTCQTCHMQRESLRSGAPHLPDSGSKAGQLASHRWLGANTAIPAYYHFDEQSRRVVEFLRNEVLSVDMFALETPDGTPGRDAMPAVVPLGTSTFSLSAGQLLTADVVIQNKAIAHSHVPEQRDIYQSWVDFTVKDSTGRVLKESGFVDPRSGTLDPRAQTFTNRLINGKGELNARHEVWGTRVVAFSNTVQSGRSQVVRYTFRMPARQVGPVTLTATVKYRRFNQHFIDFGMDLPADQHYPQTTVEMASDSVTLVTGENLPTEPLTHRNPEWMRWNNYGIATLDSQQYALAVGAFSRVIGLRSDYPDGYTNRALTEIQAQRYDEARADLQQSLIRAPGNGRALYYRALVERNSGDLNAAVGDLQQVVQAFPSSRDALRELGFSYYQRGEYLQAQAEYEALQQIDPDDLAGHYMLAILYRRLHLKDRAAAEAATFVDEKDDPTASVYALSYLRKHAADANESVMWHTHNLESGDAEMNGPLPTSFTATQQ